MRNGNGWPVIAFRLDGQPEVVSPAPDRVAAAAAGRLGSVSAEQGAENCQGWFVLSRAGLVQAAEHGSDGLVMLAFRDACLSPVGDSRTPRWRRRESGVRARRRAAVPGPGSRWWAWPRPLLGGRGHARFAGEPGCPLP